MANERLSGSGDLVRVLGCDEGAGWRQSAVCAQVGPEVFFPAKGHSAKPAKRICSGCSVRAECLAWALLHDEHGVWGGLTEAERRAVASRERLRVA
jgi:WhiB family redox-sensing transcriptional regulator